MIQFPNLNEGILIYAQNTTDDPELGKIIELRVDNEFDYRYRARYFGIYCPVYKLYFNDVDRLLIKLPPIESDVVYPVQLERVKASNLYFDYDFVHFFDNLRSPQHLYPRPGAVYNISREGFNFVSGKLFVDHETVPVKFKLHIPNTTSYGKFHLYNPETGYLMWTIMVDGLRIYINDVLKTTLSNESEIEMDIGFDTTSLRINIFESDELLYTVTDSSPLNTMPAISDSVLEIEGLDTLTIDWLFCYKACFENTKVYSVLEYTNFEQFITAGQPMLTHIHRFGMRVARNQHINEEIGVERTITDAELDRYGMRVALRKSWTYSNPLELKIYNVITDVHPFELRVLNNYTFSHPMVIPVGGIVTKDSEYTLKASKTGLSEYGAYGMKLVKHQYVTEELGIQRKIALQEDYYYGMQMTHIKDFVPYGEYAMTVFKDSGLEDEEILLMAIKKSTFNITIESEVYEKYVLRSIFSGGGIESE